MIGYFPKVSAASLFHWGTMKEENINKSGFSQEGNNLSLSECPDSWSKLLKLKCGDKLFSFSKANGVFVDILALLNDASYINLREKLRSLAFSEGLIKQETLYKVEYEDSETEQIMFMVFESKDEAYNEAYDEEDVSQTLINVGTQELIDRLGISKDLARIRGEEYAYIELIKKNIDVDGIFWGYENDINIYSLPLYCIFPSKVSEWSYKEVK